MNQKVKELLKLKFGKVRGVSDGSYRIACPTCDPKHSKKMKRYVRPGMAYSKCFICEQTIALNELLGENITMDRSEAANDEPEYKYATILPYDNAAKLSDLDSSSPVIKFMVKDHLFNFPYYDSLGVRYIPSGCGKNISFDSGYTVNTSESLFFPVFAKDNSYAGWQLRFIPGTWNGDRFQFMRYMHLFPKGKHLFNYAFARQYKDVVVVEGVKKALKLANSVATFGKGISVAQKQLIQEWKTITLILDGEDNTQELARDIQAEFISNGRKCVNIDLRNYGFESPDDTTSEQLQYIIQKEHEQKRTRSAVTQ